MDSIADVLFTMRCRGIKIWLDNGQVHYQQSSGSSLTPADIEGLRTRKGEIVAFLGGSSANAGEPRPVPRLPSEAIPLSFSQQMWWNLLGMDTSRVMRRGMAFRLTGQLVVDLMKESIPVIVSRHEAMRTRIVKVAGELRQEVSAAREFNVELIDLQHIPESAREAEAKRLIEEIVNKPIDVAVDPLFSVGLLKLAEHDHVLFVAADHLISDGVSGGIFMRELWKSYEQASRKQPLSLDAVTVQFPDYAVWQRKTNAIWAGKRESYWASRLSGAERARLPGSGESGQYGSVKGKILPIGLGQELSAQLREFSRGQRTSVAMSVLTVYAASLLRLYEKSDIVIPVVEMGRYYPEVEHTYGFFPALLFLRLEVSRQDSFLDLLNNVTKEYQGAYDHHDLGRIGAQVPTPGFARNASFSWLPRRGLGLDTTDIDDGRGNVIRQRPLRFTVPPLEDLGLDREPLVVLAETDEGIAGVLCYRSDRFPASLMGRFAQGLRDGATRLVNEPEKCALA
jgi:Condensation domain/TubC N-terminal docking domain